MIPTITADATPVTSALRRRRMQRVFTDQPVGDELLERLAWAASRAPAGGNQPMRQVVVVTDPRRVEALRMVTPSFGATGNLAVLVLCTDLRVATERMGTLGRDLLSLIDAGAAAENIALTGPEIGLGVSFVRSSNDSAIRAVLELPAHVRPDLMIAVGHPGPRAKAAARVRPVKIYRNRYGQPWDGVG